MPSGQEDIDKAHSEQNNAQEQFEITFDANPAPSVIIRLSDIVPLKANPGLPEITGRDNRELEGRNVSDLELFISTETFKQAIKTLKQGKSVVKAEVRMCSATEGERIVVMSANPIELEEDACGIFTFTDITDLRRAEERFAQVFRLTPMPIALLDLDDRFIDVNKSFEELTGYSHNEVVGRQSTELEMWSSSDDPKRMEDELREHGEFRELELLIRTKKGEVRYVAGSGKVLEVDGGEMLLHIFHDITGRKQSEEQFHKAIQAVMSDTTWFSRQLLGQLSNLRLGNAEPYEEINLSRRERQVLAHLARGENNDTIGEELRIATQTVRNYVSTIYDKLGVHSRAEAVVWAREHGVI